MNTVATRLTDDTWTDLTAVWAAATPPAVDGETIVAQAADTGVAHAVVIVQAAAPPSDATGHLVADDLIMRLTGASGRKHYGRAYTGSAVLVASGEGVQ